jgi:hypothetical protein
VDPRQAEESRDDIDAVKQVQARPYGSLHHLIQDDHAERDPDV